jgi:hypothetical protein
VDDEEVAELDEGRDEEGEVGGGGGAGGGKTTASAKKL